MASPRESVPTPTLLGTLLRDVSRSFFLTLRALPRRLREPIGLAYLLARTTDTVADTGVLSPEDRHAALNDLRSRILGLRAEPLDFARFVPGQGSAPERSLLQRAEEAIALLNACAPADRTRIRETLSIIISGQELDLRRFGQASPQNLRALNHVEELDDYTYRVAGCVGEFWTRMCLAHLPAPPLPADAGQRWLAQGVRFGKGLQLINILRDLPADLRLGRCYLPATELQERGLEPAELLDPAAEARLRPLYHRWLNTAQEHLEAGWCYTNSLPRQWTRIRLACSWPILIGTRTLALLRTTPILDPARRIKINRGEVRSIVLGSLLRYPWPKLWQQQFAQACVSRENPRH